MLGNLETQRHVKNNGNNYHSDKCYPDTDFLVHVLVPFSFSDSFISFAERPPEKQKTSIMLYRRNAQHCYEI